MEFLKKHYEKLVLGVVLLGLTVAVCLLPVIISSKRAALEQATTGVLNPKVKELPPVDMTVLDAALQRVQTPIRLNFTHNHNLFNPVLWAKGSDGRPQRVVSGPAMGPEALEVTDIKPLYLWLTFNGVSGSSYLVGFTNQAAPPSKRTGEKLASRGGGKGDLFTLVDVHGPEDKPTELVLKLNDLEEPITVGPGKPYKQVVSYAADLHYPVGNKNWRDQRTNSPALNIGDGQYIIVAISQTNVIVSSKQNEKKTTIPLKAPTETR